MAFNVSNLSEDSFKTLCGKLLREIYGNCVVDSPPLPNADFAVNTVSGVMIVLCCHGPTYEFNEINVKNLRNAMSLAKAPFGAILTDGHFTEGAANDAEQGRPRVELFDLEAMSAIANQQGITIYGETRQLPNSYFFPYESNADFIEHFKAYIEATYLMFPEKVGSDFKLLKRSPRYVPFYLVKSGADRDFYRKRAGCIYSCHPRITEMYRSGEWKSSFSNDFMLKLAFACTKYQYRGIPVAVDDFGRSASVLEENARNYLRNHYSRNVTYNGYRDNLVTTWCEIYWNDTFAEANHLYLIESEITYEIAGHTYSMEILETNSSNIRAYTVPIHRCGICNKELGDQVMICSKCHRIVGLDHHSTRCVQCGCTVCTDCSKRFKKLLFTKSLCNSCASLHPNLKYV